MTISILNAAPGGFSIASTGGHSMWAPILAGGGIHLDYSLPVPSWAVQVSGGGIGTHDALVPIYAPIINEIIQIARTEVASVKYGVNLSDQAIAHALLQVAVPVTVSGGGIGIHDTNSVIRGIVLAELVGLGSILGVNAKYGVTVAQRMKLLDGLFKFFSGTLSDGLGFHDGMIPLYQPTASVAEQINIAPAQTPSLVIGVTLNSGVQLTHTQVLKMIFQGDHLADGIKITALYISPDGNYTTWAINTRTGAVTEYQNYVFNSFAKIGNHYVGANMHGIWYLDGERDGVSNIVAHIKSGRMAPGGSKFTSFRSAYLGITTRDDAEDFILKMVAADGREYIYGVKPQPDGVVTKVNMGKGLRSRYFSFELISPGADFDLDSIEFIPIVSQRRV